MKLVVCVSNFYNVAYILYCQKNAVLYNLLHFFLRKFCLVFLIAMYWESIKAVAPEYQKNDLYRYKV